MNRKGFTLVEIIAVIVIMGILLLVVVPTTTNLMRSNEEKEYVTYYEIVQEGLEKYARTRRNEVGGTQDVGCIDDKNLADLIRLGYVKEFDQEDDVFCGTPTEFDNGLLNSWGIDTSKTYASMRVEGDHGKITIKLSLICVKMNEDGTYGETPEYTKLIEVGPDCKTMEMYDPMDKFNIIYDYDGGTAPTSGVPAFYYYGKGATIDGVPTKANNTFNGWNNGSNTKIVQTIGLEESGEKTFTAKWCRNCAATNGATCSLDATSTPGTCRYTTTCPENYNITNNGKYNPSCSPKVWNITYTGGETLSGTGTPTSYTYGVGATINGTASRSGYLFNGWEYNSTKAKTHTITTTDTGDKTFKSLWCRKCSATSPASCTLNASTPGACKYATSCPANYTISNNGQYNPSCTANTYQISYNYDGGTAPSSGVPATYTYGTGATVNGKPTKNNYTFNGWNNGSTTAFSHTIGTTETGDKAYTAKWCRDCAATGGASCTLNATSTPGTCTYTTSCPTGYTISNNGKYNPSCSANTYTLTYDNNGGSGCTSKTGTYGTAWGTLCTPTKSGNDFKGWFTAKSGGTQVTKDSVVSGDLKVYAHWESSNKAPTVDLKRLRGTSSGTCGIASITESKTTVCTTCTGSTCPCVIQALYISPPSGYTFTKVVVKFSPVPSDHSNATNTWTTSSGTKAFQKYTYFSVTDSKNEKYGEQGVGTNKNFFTSGNTVILRFRNENGTNGITVTVDVNYSNGTTGSFSKKYNTNGSGCCSANHSC